QDRQKGAECGHHLRVGGEGVRDDARTGEEDDADDDSEDDPPQAQASVDRGDRIDVPRTSSRPIIACPAMARESKARARAKKRLCATWIAARSVVPMEVAMNTRMMSAARREALRTSSHPEVFAEVNTPDQSGRTLAWRRLAARTEMTR